MEWRELPTLIGILVINLLTIGFVAPAMSFFLVDFKLALNNSSAANIGLTHSLFFGAISIFGPLAVIVSKRIGDKQTIIIGCAMVSVGMMMTSQTTTVWQLLFTHSLISGVGISLIVTSTVFIIGQHFSGSTVYLGFLYAGSASGMLITPILCAEAKLFLGFRGTLLNLGAISMHSIPISILIFRRFSKTRRKSETNNSIGMIVDGTRGTTVSTVGKDMIETTVFLHDSPDNITISSRKLDSNMATEHSVERISTLHLFWQHPKLILLGFIRALAEYAYIGFFIHFIASVIYKGISQRNAAYTLASYGLGSLLGRLTAFFPEHVHCMKKSNSFIAAMLIIGILTISFDYTLNVYIIITFAALIGYFVGWYLILFPAIVRDSVCKERFKDVYGFIIIPGGVITTFAGYTGGLIYDASGLYRLSFFIAGGIFILNGVLMVIGDVGSKLKRTSRYKEADTAADVSKSA